MLNLNRLLDRSDFFEDENVLIITAVTLNPRMYRFWQFLDKELNRLKLGEVTIIGEFGEDISISGNSYSGNEVCRLSIQKRKDLGLFFHQKTFIATLKKKNLLLTTYRLIFSTNSFQSYSVTFLDRKDFFLEGNPTQNKNADVNKNKLEKVFPVSINEAAIAFIPKLPNQWITNQTEKIPSFWKTIAAAKIFTTLATEVNINNNLIETTFRGARRSTLVFDLNVEALSEILYPIINKAAKWIYLDGYDIETRFTIFNNQVSIAFSKDRETIDSASLSVLINSLENSILAYRYYIMDSNKEFNNSLIELNKMLFEHVSRIRQNTVDLTNSLWRDFTTAFGLIILNFSFKKPEIYTNYWLIFSIGVIIYLCFSYYLSSSIGFWFYYKLKKSLAQMKTHIYSYLPEEHFKEFAISPLKYAQRKYIITFWLVLLCYLAIISFIVLCIQMQIGNLSINTL